MQFRGQEIDWFDIFFGVMLTILLLALCLLFTLPFWPNHLPK